jgi:hypothetical protein
VSRVGGHTYDDSNKAYKRNTKRNRKYLEKKKQTLLDTLDTAYECPVCLKAIPLREAGQHCRAHRQANEVTSYLEDLVYGLEYVAHQVERNNFVYCSYCGAGLRPGRLKRHEARCRKKKTTKNNSRGSQSDKALPEYGSAKEDLFDTGRVVSGGGGPGTGKRR